jgi:hypothetical protein
MRFIATTPEAIPAFACGIASAADERERKRQERRPAGTLHNAAGDNGVLAPGHRGEDRAGTDCRGVEVVPDRGAHQRDHRGVEHQQEEAGARAGQGPPGSRPIGDAELRGQGAVN